MSDKYIIKNCPAFDSKYNECHSKIEPHKLYCQDCTDCVLKQIVELCGKYHVIDAGYQKVAINYLSSDILKLLDIQEVE
jgi:hypothetical protein